MKKVFFVALCCLAPWALLAGGAWAADVCVSDAAGLNTALTNAAGNTQHDTIKVVQGTYTRTGNFTYNSSQGYNIALRGGYLAGCASRVINPANTVLDGGGTGKVLNLSDSNGGSIQVEGFTIQNGDSAGDGSGVFAESYSNSGQAGDVTLTTNIITGNATDSSHGGGGAYARSYSPSGTAGTVTLLNNIIFGNSANVGGGVFASSYSVSGTPGLVTITNNTITGNTAGDNGGGALLYAYSSVLPGGIVNCYNNIIRGNTATTAGGDIYFNGADTSNGYNNDYDPAAMYGSWNNSGSNINLDPLFVGGGDYRLQATSPCIETGTNGAPSIPSTDAAGNGRVLDGNNDGTQTADMGAYEFVAHTVLHTDGAVWNRAAGSGWNTAAPPYYPGTNYAVDLAFTTDDDGTMAILHRDGALWYSNTGWVTTTPPYYPGTDYARSLQIYWWISSEYYTILHKDGAVYDSGGGWNTASPPYHPGTAYARDLEVRTSTYGGPTHLAAYVLHQDGAIWNSDTGWNVSAPPYYPGTSYAMDLEFKSGGYMILHRDGAIYDSVSGWILTAPPYYPGTAYAVDLHIKADGANYYLLHKDGAIYDSVSGWITTAPPYYPGTAYAVDLEVR